MALTVQRWSRRRVVRTAVLTVVLVYLLFTFLLVARRTAELQADTNWAPGMARHIPPSYSTGHDNRPRPTRANRMHALARDKPPLDVYSPPFNRSLRGRTFPRSALAALLPPGNVLEDIPDRPWSKFVFATGASSGFFKSSLGVISSIHRYYPNRTIVYYDLGLKPAQARQLNPGPGGKHLCHFQYRKLNFTKYPAHVSVLSTYAWKLVIIMEILTEHPGLYWADASCTIQSGGDKVSKAEMMGGSAGQLLFSFTGHSNFATTHPQMYQYFPTDIERQKKTAQYEATMVLFNTGVGYENVLRWAFLCALTADCIAPSGSKRACRFKKDRWSYYGNCHRYDQAAMNLLLSNWLDFNITKYVPVRDYQINFFKIKRGFVGDSSHLSYCPQ